MNSETLRSLFPVLARWLVGGLFIYMGVSKVLHPIEFLKLVRQYEILHHHLALNAVAAILPWFEVLCGVLLVLGVAVRGAALIALAMLIPFTVIVLLRALDLQHASGLPFCAIKFDCGCGAGEVFICRKLTENLLLMLASVAVIIWHKNRLSLRFSLLSA